MKSFSLCRSLSTLGSAFIGYLPAIDLIRGIPNCFDQWPETLKGGFDDVAKSRQ